MFRTFSKILNRTAAPALRSVRRRLEERRRQAIYRNKITRIHRHHALQLDNTTPWIVEHQRLWARVQRSINPMWAQVYEHVSGRSDHRYVPEDVYYHVLEPILNYAPMLKAHADKNLYRRLYHPHRERFPTTVMMRINGAYYDQDYTPIRIDDNQPLRWPEHAVVAKNAIDSSGGHGVEVFVKQGEFHFNQAGDVLCGATLNRLLNDNYVVQRSLAQHPFLRQFNTSSVNTIRILTYRSVANEEVIALHAVLRVGRPGSFVDNQAAGGVSISVDPDGRLGGYAVDKLGNKYYQVGDVDLCRARVVPGFSEMVACVRSVAREHVYSRVVGFDVSRDSAGDVRIVEMNNMSIEINFHQMTSGALFREYTDEVLSHCIRHRS